MTFAEIETAIGQRLADLDPAYPIAWPNKDYDPKADGAVPYIEFRHVPTLRSDDSLEGGHEYQTGIALLTVVTMRDSFSTQGNLIAGALAGLFYYGLRITTDDGFVQVMKPADPVAGFVDGVYWRQPVRVTYRTSTQSGGSSIVEYNEGQEW
jgi:hypothetical protein